VSAPADLPASARRVETALCDAGLPSRIVTFAESTRTAAAAAAAIGCTVAQIAKSLVFRALESDRAVLVIASGTNRVDEAKVAAALGEAIGRADAAFVRTRTGYAIGGVPPVGHAEPPVVFVDADLARHAVVWAAAGTPNAVFETRFDDLVAMTGGRPIAIA